MLRVRDLRHMYTHACTYTYLEEERLLGDVALLELDELLHGE